MILSGAGLSAESGIHTFRDHDGLWEKHDVMKVCSTQGWIEDHQLVTRFYNDRRRDLEFKEPNHVAQLEHDYRGRIIQNDNGKISLKNALMPAMISMDKKIVLQDCLSYLLEDY